MYTATNVRRNGNRPGDGQSGSRKARARAASEDVGCAHEYEKYAHLWAKQTRVRCCTRSWNGTIGQVTGLCGWKHTRARSRLDMWTPDYARATAPRKRNVSCTPYSPFSSLATYIRINRRKDGRSRCIPASSSDRGNENTSADHGKIWCCGITWEILARNLLRPCITVVWPPIISCLFYVPSPNNRKDFAPLGRLIGRRVHYCIDISRHAGTTPIGKIPRRIRRGKWFTLLVTFWMVTRRCVGTIALRYVEHSW